MLLKEKDGDPKSLFLPPQGSDVTEKAQWFPACNYSKWCTTHALPSEERPQGDHPEAHVFFISEVNTTRQCLKIHMMTCCK